MIIKKDCLCSCSDTPPPKKCPELSKKETKSAESKSASIRPAKDTLVQLNRILEDFEAVRKVLTKNLIITFFFIFVSLAVYLK